MVKRQDLLVTVSDQPYLKNWWRPIVGLFSSRDEVSFGPYIIALQHVTCWLNKAILRAIPLTKETEIPVDVVFRLTYPMNLSSAKRQKLSIASKTAPKETAADLTAAKTIPVPATWVFGTTEILKCLDEMKANTKTNWKVGSNYGLNCKVLKPECMWPQFSEC
jgi:hypothetical protein